MGNVLSCLYLGNSSTSSTKRERVRYRKATIRRPLRHPQVSRERLRRRADPMYSPPPCRSVRYVWVDLTKERDYDPPGTKHTGGKAIPYPSLKNSEPDNRRSDVRVRGHALDPETIEERLRRNLLIASHNADIAARPALAQRRVRFNPVVRIG